MAQAVMANLFDEVLDTVDKINEAREFIRKEYLDESKPGAWALMCSYGKDSEVLLTLTMEAVKLISPEHRNRHIYILSSDTRVESPMYKQHVYSERARVDATIEADGLPMSTHIVKPEIKRSYYVTLLGYGHPISKPGQRRCTHQLKIEPIENFLKGIEYTAKLAGVRAAESTARSGKYGDAEFEITDKSTGKRMLIPLNKMTDDDIWTRLMAQLAFGSSLPVRQLYTKQSKECGFLNPGANNESGGDCGGRNGCTVCPVIMSDKSTEAMADHHPWLWPHVEWRYLHIDVYGVAQAQREADMSDTDWEHAKLRQKLVNRYVRRVVMSGYMRNGKRLKYGAGCFSLEARKYLLAQLLEKQHRMWELAEGEEEIEVEDMICQEQLDHIYMIHAEDEAERPYLSTGITDVEEAIQGARLPAEQMFERILQRRQRENERREREKERERLKAVEMAIRKSNLFNWQDESTEKTS